jgi:hypothetical protein
VAYSTVADLYANGLQRGAIANPGRLAAGVNVTTNAITLEQHGFTLNDHVTLRPEGNGTMPAPLVAGVTYYAIPVNGDAFSVAAAPDGAAIDLTSTGAKVVVGAEIPFAAAIAFADALIDDFLPAHLVPLTAPYPPIVVVTSAELAIGKLLATTGNGSKSIGAMVDEARKRLADWARGRPLRGTNTDHQTPANLAASASLPYRDARGWGRYGGIG